MDADGVHCNKYEILNQQDGMEMLNNYFFKHISFWAATKTIACY